MKTLRILLPFLLCMTWFTISAQRPPGPPKEAGPRGERKEERREEIESMKIAFLTRKLDLSPDEAKKFWPVYNQFSNELKKLREDQRSNRRDAKNDMETMNDRDVEKIVDGEIAFRQQELDVVKKYHSQFKQVLPIKKVGMLYRSEEEFKKELLERIRERKNDRKQ